MNYRINDILLRHYRQKDQDCFVDLFMDEELCQFMSGGAFDKEKDAIKLFDFFLQLSAQTTSKQVYGIFIAETYIGHFEIDQRENQLEIIYMLQKTFWGNGIMSKIINFFNQQYDEEIFARVMPNNNNSIKLLEKIGVAKKTLSTFNEQKVIKYTLAKPNKS